MASTSADRRRVFLAFRTVFTGPQAQIRRVKKVREAIEQHKASFQPLIKDFGLEKVVDIVKTLLDNCIFESEAKAKIAFPELFQSSPARDVQRNESENDAARSAAEALEEVESGSEGQGPGEDQQEEDVPEESVAAAKSTKNAKSAPSLYPSYIPYRIQHLILTKTQRLLEECCFEWAAKWMPSLLAEHRWDCPEAVELTKWTRTLAKRYEKLPASAIENSSETSLKEVFFSTNVLRHTAVHRLPTTARGIHTMIRAASRLAQTLGDYPRATELGNLQLEIGSRIRDMELNKNFLENRLDAELQAIAEQRAQLDRSEREAIETMLREDEENKLLVGSFLEDAFKTTLGRSDENASVEPTHMTNGLHESDEDSGEKDTSVKQLVGY